MLLHVCAVNPREGGHEHLVHGGGEVAYETHQEEGNLQDGVLDELHAVDDITLPGGVAVVVGDERDEVEQKADGESGQGDEEADGEARHDGQGGLAVMRTGEDGGVLQGAVGANEGQLGAAQDGVRLESAEEGEVVAHLRESRVESRRRCSPNGCVKH